MRNAEVEKNRIDRFRRCLLYCSGEFFFHSLPYGYRHLDTPVP